ncbi:L,D-transpeptidase family protein [Iamia majanohamensis]|uniref:L,D-transpeptidase family protein n=1 Tax=Iamia majanohamensis TaxID=467976 RepID=A0AAF0BSK4_9ACTN|nr:L,D-transpeptidase family protein [Iamia majanohamensis]WCO68466.1 L,D-transpeptidase family protein [Iamia majanohamensis]
MPRRTLPAALIAAVVLSLLAAGACAAPSDDQEATASGGAATDRAAERVEASATPSTAAPSTPPSSAPPEPTTTTPPPTAPPTTAAPTTTATTAPPPPPIEEGDLVRGVRGERTRALQERLAALAYDPGPADGQFGLKTAMAVWAFQALHGLPRDGVVTAEVEAAIMGAPPQGMLRPDLGPTHTEVDLDRQVLLVWGDGVLELVTHVSSGSGVAYCEDGHCGDAVTPVGDYRYQRRIAGERHAPLGVLYDPVYFNGGIAVHGAPSVPDHPASHGCVRIPLHISSYFQSLVADGEPIATFRSGGGPSVAVAPAGAPAAPPPAGAENGG